MDVLNAWARRMRVQPACVSVHCGELATSPQWTSVLTHQPPRRPQLCLSEAEQQRDEVSSVGSRGNLRC